MLAAIISAMLGQADLPLELLDVRVVSPQPVTLGRDTALTLRAKLKNRSKHPLRLWDPNNTEGSMCLFASLRPSSGPAIELRSVSIPRAGGVPTSIMLRPEASVDITADFGWSLAAKGVAPGTYSIALIYRNRTANSGPVRGVWTGSISSKATKIKIIK